MAYRTVVCRLRQFLWRCNMFVSSWDAAILLSFCHCPPSGRPLVDLALKLNVLAVLAAIVFVSAIVLGAF